MNAACRMNDCNRANDCKRTNDCNLTNDCCRADNKKNIYGNEDPKIRKQSQWQSQLQ